MLARSLPAEESLVNVYGLLAYSKLVTFEQVARNAELAPDLHERALLNQFAAAELPRYAQLADRLGEWEIGAEEAMEPFVSSLDEYHRANTPRSWLEGLVKITVGDSIAEDLCQELAQFLPDPDRGIISAACSNTDLLLFACKEVYIAVGGDPSLADSLALWARRLIGEAVLQWQLIAADHQSLAQLIVTGSGGFTGVTELVKRLSHLRNERLHDLGLKS